MLHSNPLELPSRKDTMGRYVLFVFLSSLIFSVAVAGPPASHPLKKSCAVEITALRCEGLTDPLGIDVLKPRFAWQLESAVRGARQTAYQILVASRSDLLVKEKGDVWNSGMVKSRESAGVDYGGPELRSGAAYYWKVRVWDQHGRASAWSAPALWSMGLLRPEDWQARWIGHDGDVGSDSSQTEHRPLSARMLRFEFELKKPVKRAYAYICGLGLSEMMLNGKKVGNDVLSPGLAQYDRKAFYVTYDVTGQLKKGANAVGVMLGNGRFFAPRKTSPVTMVSYGYPKLLLQMKVEFSDGTSATITSNEKWKWTADGPIRENNEYDGEVCDARREMKGWTMPGFNDGSWAPADIVQPGSPKLEAQMNEPIRVTDHIKPVVVTSPRGGVYVFDMGQNMVGWVRLMVRGPRGTSVTMRFAETLDKEGNLYVANLRSARQTDTYILRGGGAEAYEPRFTYHGFRYVEMTGFPGTPDLNTILGCVVHDDVESTGSFSSSNALLNHIVRNARWGILGNYRSMPTDCPQRDERHGWLGDRAIESGGESFLFDVSKLYAKWLNDIRDAQLDNGSLPDLAPSYWPTYNDNVTWAGTYLIVPQMLYGQFGDRRIIERHYPTMKKWLALMDTYMADGIMPRDTYGDWCVPPELPRLIQTEDPARMTNGAFIGSAYYCYVLRLMSEYATLVEKPEESKEFARRADSLRVNLNRKFYDPARKLYVNGTVTSSLLGLAFNLVPDADRESLYRNLTTRIMTSDSGHVATGLIGCQWLCRTLAENGRPDITYTLLTQKTYPSLGYMLSKGATTIWELWNGDTGDPGMNSGNHVMLTGDLVIWLFENVAGIASDSRGSAFEHLVMRPTPLAGLTAVDASYRSRFGTIVSKWHAGADGLAWRVKIPVNTTAEVWLPADNADQVTEGGKDVRRAAGVMSLRREKGFAVLELESGMYELHSKGYRAPIPAAVVARDDQTGKVSMMAAVDGGLIRYTLDGGEPTLSSPMYVGPFLRLGASEIKAKTFMSNGDTSPLTTASFGQVTVQPPRISIGRAVVEDPGTAQVEIAASTGGSIIHYTLDGSDPTVTSPVYEKAIVVNKPTVVRAVAVVEGWKPSIVVEGVAMFTHARRSVTLNLPYSPKYPGNGDRVLIDGITGSIDFRDPAWQGYEGTDFEAVVDLGGEIPVTSVSAGFLSSPGAWIFPPVEVEYSLSVDGKQYSPAARERFVIDSTANRSSMMRTHARFPETEARFVRIHARNVGICPPWHRGAGGKAWIFVDEIAVR